MRSSIWSLLLILFPYVSGAQQVKSQYFENLVAPTPEAVALGEFGSVPMNYYTGLPEISINLMELSSRELKIPIGLAYDASGVRLDDISGPVGLKWGLNAGGYVMREMKGLPDEIYDVLPSFKMGYWQGSSSTNYYRAIDVREWIDGIAAKSLDCCPDEFVISLPGRSIRFVFDKNKGIVTIPRQNVKLTYTLSNKKLYQFTLVLEDGTKYIFGGTTNSVEERKLEILSITPDISYPMVPYSWSGTDCDPRTINLYEGESRELGSNTTYKEKAIDFYSSKWNLISMEAPSGDKITFNYLKVGTTKYIAKPASIWIAPAARVLSSYSFNVSGCHSCFFWCTNSFQHTFTANNVYALRKYKSPSDPLIPQDPFDPQETFEPRYYPYNGGGALITYNLTNESIVKLVDIVASNGSKVTFSASTRTDFPTAIKYDQMNLYNSSGTMVKAIRLYYFTQNAMEDLDPCWLSEVLLFKAISGVSSQQNHYANSIRTYAESQVQHGQLKKYVYEAAKDYNYKRLFLESIVDVTNSAMPVKLYDFFYSQQELLRRRTGPMSDLYGYPRSSGGVMQYLSISATGSRRAYVFSPWSPLSGLSEGRDQVMGVLTKIVYPTRGVTVFDFRKGLNVRCHGMTDLDVDGKTLRQQEIEYVTSKSASSAGSQTVQDFKFGGGEEWMKYVITSNTPQNESFGYTHGVLQGNELVRAYSGTKSTNIGYEEYEYFGPVSMPDSLTLVYSSPDTYSPSPRSSIFPYPKNRSFDHARGLLRRHTTFNTTSLPVKEEIYEYSLNPMGYKPRAVYGFSGGSFIWSSQVNTTFWYGYVNDPLWMLRHARYRIAGDWVVLSKKTEKVYDQSNLARSISKVTEFVYNLYSSQLAQEKTYNESDPTNILITKRKYVSDGDYSHVDSGVDCQGQWDTCQGDCLYAVDPEQCSIQCSYQYSDCMDGSSSPTGDVQALLTMQTRGQVAAPVEVISLLDKNGNQQVLSSVAYKYQKLLRVPTDASTEYTKPKEVWGVNRLIPAQLFQESKVVSGALSIDGTLRKLHTFNTYDAPTGNLLTQTSFDGIVSQYGWGFNNSLVTSYTINPGSLQHASTYNHRPLVGMLSLTDPNGIKKYFEYDALNRLKLTKDNNQDYTSRVRYHYSGMDELGSSITVNGSLFVGSSLTISSTDPFNTYHSSAVTNYSWDFGDGTSLTSTSNIVTKKYSAPGVYTIRVNKVNPEANPITATTTVTITAPLGVTICDDGPSVIDICGNMLPIRGSCTTATTITNNSPTVLKATATNGCSSYSYNWQYRVNGGSWFNLSSGQHVSAPPGFVARSIGYYEVRCTVTDSCGNSVTSTILSLTVFKGGNC